MGTYDELLQHFNSFLLKRNDQKTLKRIAKRDFPVFCTLDDEKHSIQTQLDSAKNKGVCSFFYLTYTSIEDEDENEQEFDAPVISPRVNLSLDRVFIHITE